MLQYMPLIGSILLTVLIAWVGISTWVANRRRIRSALAGHSYCVIPNGQAIMPEARKSICCGAATFRPRWTADGWVAPCQCCGEWQYLGDDYEHPPEDAILSEVTSDWREQVLAEHYGEAQTRRFDKLATDFSEDEGEPLPASMSHAPNIGGEGNPDYQGPHYVSRNNPVQQLIKAGVLDEDDPNVQAWRDYCDEPVGEPPEAASGPVDDGQLVGRPTFAMSFTSNLGPDDMLIMMRGGKKLRPVSWNNSALLGDAYCYVRDRHTFVEHRPRTGGLEVSPAIQGIRDAIQKYGGAWLDVTWEIDGTEVTSELTDAMRLRDDYRQAHPDIAAMWTGDDEGEELAIPPQPNIGGEDHPDYAGPHYAAPVDYGLPENRFVPYDVLRDPPDGAAVHFIGNAACVGPLDGESQGDEGHDVSAEDNNRSD